MALHAAARYSLLLTGVSFAWRVAPAQQFTVVDVESVRAEGPPAAFMRAFDARSPAETVTCDALVAGAGMGGLAAAMRLSERGHSVCLTEETRWIGGQMTAGGVSALDEHKFIEIS